MKDLDVLARTLYGEAEVGDDLDAKAIACVVRNRVQAKQWPNTVAGVCFQPYQFSCWNADNPRRTHISEAPREGNKWLDQCYVIAELILNGTFRDITNGSTHYYATYIKAPKWAKGLKPVFQTNGGKYTHLFFNNVDTKAPVTPSEALKEIKPLTASRTVQTAGGLIATGGVAAVVPVLDQVQQVLPAVHGLAAFIQEYQGLGYGVLGALLLAAGVFLLYLRFRDRRAGVR